MEHTLDFLHSYRAFHMELPARSDRSIARLYLLSHPFPANIAVIQISVVGGTHSLFENPRYEKPANNSWYSMTVFHPKSGTDIQELEVKDDIYQTPEDCSDLVESQGWTIHPGPEPNCMNRGETDSYIIHATACSPNYKEKEGQSSVCIRKNDRIGLWIHAQVRNPFN